MGLLNTIIFWPVTGPVAGIKWTLGKVQRVVEDELVDDTPVKEALMELQIRLELGDIDDETYVAEEAALMRRLRDVREWRERLGMGTAGGPVRMARASDEADSGNGGDEGT